MKKILCFGDSNTYGFNPNDFNRYKENERWSGILKNKFNVIECGCNNRSIFNNSGELNSLLALPKYLADDLTHIILQVGINDLQFQYNIDLGVFENKLKELISLIRADIKIILLCPNTINDCILSSYFARLFNKNSIEKSIKLPEIYEKIAKVFNCEYFDLNNVTTTSKIDGLHYDVDNHKIIADYLLKVLN